MTINNNFTRAEAKPAAQSITSTQGIMHESRDHALNAAHRACAACGCDDCNDVKNRLEGAPSFKPSANMALDKSQTAQRFSPSYVPLNTRDNIVIERGNAESVLDILNRLQAKGLLSSAQAQLAAATLAVRPMVNNAKV